MDETISAQLPPDPESLEGTEDKKNQARRLQQIILTNMVHGPCGKINPNSPCMVDGKCSKGYPKPFCKTTFVDPDSSHPVYQRLSPEDGGRVVQLVRGGKTFTIDNSWIVPHAPYLSLRFYGHINVENCLSPTAAKYLYKYLTKGAERAMVRTEVEGQERDEVQEYMDLRCIGSSEAVWHLFAFPISKKYPAVYALRIHLEDEQQVVFSEETMDSAAEVPRDTELVGFFAYNMKMKKSKKDKLTYVDFPKKFVWDKDTKEWRERKQESDTIGRVHSVTPAAGDVFYLRVLLHHSHCKGKTSFKNLMTINRRKKESFQEVCRELGLLQDDKEWDLALAEGAATQMCPALRELFITILLFCNPGNPEELFSKHFLEWADDFIRKAEKRGVTLSEQQLRTLVLLDIETRLQSREASLAQFHLPSPTEEELREVDVIESNVSVLIREELDFDIPETREWVAERQCQFTTEQEEIFKVVMNAVVSKEPLQVFIDARGGCGKTFVLNGLLAAVRSMEAGGCPALAMATTGIAADLLTLGRTFHSRMKAPLTPAEDSIFNITAQSTLAELIKQARLLLIDEATMLHRYQLEAMDRTLQDLLSDDRPFGGKVLVLSGDYRQCLPVVPRASRAGVVDTCLTRSLLWSNFKVMKLSVNMRVRASGDPVLEAFDTWTLSIGDGTAETVGEDTLVEINPEVCVKIEANTDKHPNAERESMKKFVQRVFPDIDQNIKDAGWLQGRVILAPTNQKVDQINDLVSASLPGKPIPLYSSDTLDHAADMYRYSTEYLNTLCPTGLPRHQLILKPGMPLMLLRNLNAKAGLCNGTKLIFHRVLDNKLLECSISGGVHNKRRVLIPRISLRPKERMFPFDWTRRQFPVRTAFAMVR